MAMDGRSEGAEAEGEVAEITDRLNAGSRGRHYKQAPHSARVQRAGSGTALSCRIRAPIVRHSSGTPGAEGPVARMLDFP